MIKVITSSESRIYKIAAEAFADMWAKVTDERPEIIVAEQPSDVPADCDIAVVQTTAIEGEVFWIAAAQRTQRGQTLLCPG